MKAVFVHKHSVLRDSHIDPLAHAEAWHLVPATLEAVRLLGGEDTLVFVYDIPAAGTQVDGDGHAHDLHDLVRQIADAGGRVDGLISYPQGNGDQREVLPNGLWVAAQQLDLLLNECYVLGDGADDVALAYQVGARPLLILGARSVGQILGNQPEHKDFPIALDLMQAVNYISVEDETRRQLGHGRNAAIPAPSEQALYADRSALPTISLTSTLAQGIRARLGRSRAQLDDVRRWMSFFILGAVGLSLGIAYMLTHLYRVQPFPSFVYYVTLQFIPRPLRGALFILWGVGAIVFAIRSFYRSIRIDLWRRRKT